MGPEDHGLRCAEEVRGGRSCSGYPARAGGDLGRHGSEEIAPGRDEGGVVDGVACPEEGGGGSPG